MNAVRTASRPCLNFKRFQGTLRIRRAGRNTRSSKPQVTKNALLPSWLLECTRQVTPPPIGLAKLSPSCFNESDFQPPWGKTRAERGDPRSRPLCRKTKFTTDAAGSLFGARRCGLKARPTSDRDIPSKSGNRPTRPPFHLGPFDSLTGSSWHNCPSPQCRAAPVSSVRLIARKS